MRNPKVVLSNLASNAKKDSYTFKRLYRNLYNIEFYLEAYHNMFMNRQNQHHKIDDNSLLIIKQLILKIKNQTYQPTPVKNTNTSKEKQLPHVLEDLLVQEVLKRILESIYEPQFLNQSHCFRPNRSCHTALQEVSQSFTDTTWLIKGNIKGVYNSIDHHFLIQLLRKCIKDEKIINLVWKFLKAGYLKEWLFYKTYSGTPLGGRISALLSNVYLHEFDKFIVQYDLHYIRYAGQFIISLKGGRRDAERKLLNVNAFLAKNLKLELDDKETSLTHWKKDVRFLEYIIRVKKNKPAKRLTTEHMKNRVNQRIELRMPKDKYKTRLIELDALRINTKNGWIPVHRTYLVHRDDLIILKTYNSEIDGMYHYYCLACNVQLLRSFRETMKSSMYKTFANKYKCTVNKVITRFKINDNFAVLYSTKKGDRVCYFTKIELVRMVAIKHCSVDII